MPVCSDELRPITPALSHALLGDSSAVAALRVEIDGAARCDAKVLLTGETGAGKEVVARAIHERSRRAAAPFLTLNCAGVPDSLLESELFGHARGSFTGAFRDHPGLLRQADGGTLFLDEAGEMSLRMQAAFLRFLETGELQTVGGNASRTHVNVRIIAATNRELLESVTADKFRSDLYYRLNVFHIAIPPLRDRREDILPLLNHFAVLFAAHDGREVPAFADATVKILESYQWPGNVRELRNVVERVVSRDTTRQIEPADLPKELLAAAAKPAPVSQAADSHRALVSSIVDRLIVGGESFWTAAYPLLMARDITREDLTAVIGAGLDQVHSLRSLVSLFNMAPSDYKRFLGVLRQHNCRPVRRNRAYGLAAATRMKVVETRVDA